MAISYDPRSTSIAPVIQQNTAQMAGTLNQWGQDARAVREQQRLQQVAMLEEQMAAFPGGPKEYARVHPESFGSYLTLMGMPQDQAMAYTTELNQRAYTAREAGARSVNDVMMNPRAEQVPPRQQEGTVPAPAPPREVPVQPPIGPGRTIPQRNNTPVGPGELGQAPNVITGDDSLRARFTIQNQANQGQTLERDPGTRQGSGISVLEEVGNMLRSVQPKTFDEARAEQLNQMSPAQPRRETFIDTLFPNRDRPQAEVQSIIGEDKDVPEEKKSFYPTNGTYRPVIAPAGDNTSQAPVEKNPFALGSDVEGAPMTGAMNGQTQPTAMQRLEAGFQSVGTSAAEWFRQILANNKGMPEKTAEELAVTKATAEAIGVDVPDTRSPGRAREGLTRAVGRMSQEAIEAAGGYDSIKAEQWDEATSYAFTEYMSQMAETNPDVFYSVWPEKIAQKRDLAEAKRVARMVEIDYDERYLKTLEDDAAFKHLTLEFQKDMASRELAMEAAGLGPSFKTIVDLYQSAEDGSDFKKMMESMLSKIVPGLDGSLTIVQKTALFGLIKRSGLNLEYMPAGAGGDLSGGITPLTEEELLKWYRKSQQPAQ